MDSEVEMFPYDSVVMGDDIYTCGVFPGPAPAACMGNLQGRLSAESTLSICQPLTGWIASGAARTAKNYHFDKQRGCALQEQFAHFRVLGHQVQKL